MDNSRSFLFYRPYVGIIQIRLPVEGFAFLSARNTGSRHFSIDYFFRKRENSPFFFVSSFTSGPRTPFTSRM